MPFRDVIGHRRLINLLARSVARQSLPPSLIFAGPAGVGKRLTAIALAQALNCLKPQRTKDAPDSVDACGACAACKRIARGVHPDVTEIKPDEKGSIKIEPVREMINSAGYRPFEGKRRVVIIDEADALERGAQNALLKTLEEPPSGSVFVLVTSRPDVLLPTVRSRCPELRFRALGNDELAQALIARGLSETEARTVAATAGGSVGQALEAGAAELVEARDVAQRVLAHVAANREPRRRLDGAKELLAGTGSGGAADREQLATHLRAMAAILRDVELLSLGSIAGLTLANPDIEAALDRLKPAYAGDRGVRAFAAVDRALVALERNASPKIVADWLLLEL